MTEKKNEKKPEKEMTKDEFFEQEIKKVKEAQFRAGVLGLAIFIGAIFIQYLIFSAWGILGLIIRVVLIPITLFLVMYFVWGPQDIFWGSFPREGYTKAILFGNHLRRFIGVPSGKGYDDEWNVVDDDNPDISENNEDIVFWGMHIIYEWPFGKVYQEKTEWERWYPSLKKAVPRRELLREFTLLNYPYYNEVVDAEDFNRLGVTLYTNVVMRIVNPKKALFKQATNWIDIVKPRLQGGYVSYIKGTTLQEMLGKGVKDLGADLLSKMPSSVPNRLLKDELIEDYGIEIVSISVLDILGSDKDEQDAIKAKAVAKLNRDADLIRAGTKAQSGAIDSIGKVIKMLAQMVAETVPIGSDEDQQSKWDTAENMLKKMMKDDPELFEKTYGQQFKTCVDILHRQMALEKGKFADFRAPDSKGATGDLMSMIIGSKLIDTSGGSSGGGSKASEGEKKEGKKGKIFDEKTRENLKNTGFPVELEDEV